MQLPFYGVSAAGIILEAWLVSLLIKHRFVSRFPYFSTFVLCDFFCNLVLVIVAVLRRPWFRWSSGAALLVSVLTGLLIIWEVMRSVFPPHSILRRLSQCTLLVIGSVVFPAVLALSWKQANLVQFPYRYFPPTFEQYLCLIEALVLLAIAAIARYYAVPLGRNMSGLVHGFGLYLLCYAMNFAALQVIPGFLPYWQFLSSALYIGLLAFWLWAFREYAPPEVAIGTSRRMADEQLRQFWTSGTAAIRRDEN